MRVSDLDQTIRFYTNVLGLEVLEQKVSPRGSHLAFLKVPNSEELIELTSFPPSGPVKVQEDLVHLAFQVESLDDTIASLHANGVNVTDGPIRYSSHPIFEALSRKARLTSLHPLTNQHQPTYCSPVSRLTSGEIR